MATLDELREANDKGVVLGLEKVAGIVPRKDIDVFMKEDPETFNLFLLALSELQSSKWSEDKMGYFEIAGIQTTHRSLLLN